MKSKLRVPFSTSLNAEDKLALEKYLEDKAIQSVTVLPSFKRKKTKLSGGEKILRCDDTVLTASTFNAEYCDFQIGCGYLVVGLGVYESSETMQHIKAALTAMAQESPMTLIPSLARFAKRRTGIDLKQHQQYRSPESIAPDRWLETVSRGVAYYLENLENDFGFGNYLPVFTEDAIDFEPIRKHLSASWLRGHGARPSDDLAHSLSGSHYLDILVADNEDDSVKTNELILSIHAHGSNFQNALHPEAVAKLKAGQLSTEESLAIVALMRQQAEINRAAIALLFLRHFKQQQAAVNPRPLIEQSHREVESCDDGQFIFYNDSQRITQNSSIFLPAGLPNMHSYLMRGGSGTDSTQHGISHNLKIPARTDATELSCTTVHLLEAQNHNLLNIALARKVSVKSKEVPLQTSETVERLLTEMTERDLVNQATSLRPLARYHVRRWRESPWQKIGLT
jgi:hypothetical protein